uniref:BZIP domain-containing protein n=1 Tax=Strigamia maritima TaxID=126957 RepID=T1J3S5_STRMM
MDDDDKPFACTASGCGMRFTNEDHLTVHKKKHEMSLNLTATIKNNTNLFVDQTPTPTRFIRNCEEVGLFQDLNPFDQQFHKAIEISKSGGSLSNETLQVPSDSDTLNTPAVLDSDLVVSTTTCISDDVPTTNRSSSLQMLTSSLQPSSTTTDSDDDEIIIIPSCVPADTTESPPLVTNSQTNTLTQTINTNQILHLSTNETNLENTPHTETQGPQIVAGSAATVVQLLLKLPDGRSVPVQIPTIPVVHTSNIQPTMATSNVTSLAKMKLKQSLIQNNQNASPNSNNMNVMTEAVDMVISQEQMSDSMDSLKFVEIINNKRRRTSDGEDPDEKRRRFLERNRAAATRCRLKRKQFISNLERRADELSGTNVQLQNEVSSLRNEVAQLKTMLLAHKDCPVTLQQKGLVESSDLISGHSSENMTTIEITSAEAIATTALTTMAHAHSVPTDPEHILPIDIIIESDPIELINNDQENSNLEVDK